jgi:hypothetical protein
MEKGIARIRKSVNLRQEVCDLIAGECLIRNNGESGFSLTLNQVVMEYFEMRTPRHVALGEVDGKAALTINFDPTHTGKLA